MPSVTIEGKIRIEDGEVLGIMFPLWDNPYYPEEDEFSFWDIMEFSFRMDKPVIDVNKKVTDVGNYWIVIE